MEHAHQFINEHCKNSQLEFLLARIEAENVKTQGADTMFLQ